MPRRRQLHYWINDDDYRFLQAVLRNRDEPVAATLRRMIRSWRERLLLERPDGAGSLLRRTVPAPSGHDR